MDERNELISYLETLKNGFDANNPLHLKGLLYLMYCDETLQIPRDERFTQELLGLVEAASAQDTLSCPMEPPMGPQDGMCCNAPVPQNMANPMGGPNPVIASPVCSWDNQPASIEFSFLSSGARALFGDYNFFRNVN